MVILQTVILYMGLFNTVPEMNNSYLEMTSMEQCLKVIDLIKGGYDYQVIKNTSEDYIISYNNEMFLGKQSFNHRCFTVK